MLQLVCLAVLILLQHHQHHAAHAAELPTQAVKPCIIAVGDGLTEGAFSRKHDGWGLLLQERYVRKVSTAGVAAIEGTACWSMPGSRLVVGPVS